MDNKRYIAQINLPEVGFSGQEKIRNSRVMVVGIGGLGCPVLQYLVGMGIGAIGMADHDTVHLSNLHRQILFNETDVDKPKAEVAFHHLQVMNSQIGIIPIVERVTSSNAEQLCSNYDIILDCTDNYESRKVIDSFCAKANIPLVFGAVQQFEGMVSVFHFNRDYGYADLFPEEPPTDSISCAQEGIMGHVAGVVASLMINEVIKIILGMDNVLSQKVLSVNLKTGHQRVLQINQRG